VREGEFAENDVLKEKRLNGNGEEIVAKAWAGWSSYEKRKRVECEIKNYPEIVDGKNAMDTPQIEGAEVARRVPKIEQDPADEEAGEDKEQIYAAPANVGRANKLAKPTWK